MSEDVQPEIVKSAPSRQRFIIYAVVLLVVFLLGLIPMWLKARQSAKSLAESEHQLTLVRMQSNLASAVIDARRGDYEPARQAASQFFTSLSTEIEKGDTSVFTQAQRERLQPLFAGRDDLITLLARSDPASADRLSDLYVSYRKIMSG
jgi:Tfp pilus assembly protein PilV